MNTSFKGVLAASAVAILSACASAPKHNPSLDQARSIYQSAAGDPQIARGAAIELQRARVALAQAESAFMEGETAAVEHYAYLTKRRTQAAMEAAKIAAANEDIRAAEGERQRIVIELRTEEARAQRERAEASLKQAQAAGERAEAAREQARTAQQQAEQQGAQAEQARLAEQAARQAAMAAQARAANLAHELEALQAKKTDRGMVLTLEDVLFDTGSAVLKPGAQHMLDQIATFLKKHPERSVMVEGHTDSVGSAEYNQFLSERRAFAVKSALVMRGVDSNRIDARGFGEAMPMVGNDTAAGRQQNRRVEIVLPDLA